MKRLSVAALLWHAKRTASSIGWPVLVVLVATAATLAIYVGQVVPLERAVSEIRQDTEVLRSKVATQSTARRTNDPLEQLRDFYSRFPPSDTVLDTVKGVFEAAAAANIALDRTEYRLTPNPVGSLSRYDLVIPIRGRYGQIRQFLAQIIKSYPNVALDGISFSRQAAAEIGVEAQLRLTVYIRGQE